MRETEKISFHADWIWADHNDQKNDWVAFRKRFSVTEVPEQAELLISVDTKYWLYVNGRLAVNEGGLFRESLPGCGYADRVDIASYLQPGENVLALLVWFYGNEGRNNVNSGRAGLILEGASLGLYSNESFLCRRHPGYGKVPGHTPAYLYGGDDVSYRAGTDCEGFENLDFDESGFEPATVYQNEVWGDAYERPIPLHRLYPLQVLKEASVQGATHRFVLPYAMTFSPYLKLEANGGEVIQIYTDHRATPGGPGDSSNLYNGHVFQYICKKGLNEYRFPAYIYGENLYLEYTDALTPEVGVYESGFDCDITGSFHCDCDILNRVVEKAARTLYVCMRDNFMDCPDRERGQWIGDVSVQAPQVMFLLSKNAQKLMKKAIYDFINLRKGDVLVGNVPGANFSELPGQSLNAVSEFGVLAQYYHYTGDLDVLRLAFEPVVNYLKLWSMDEQGLVCSREGGWPWFDHLNNVDAPVLENEWYYSALSFAQKMAQLIDDHRYDDFLAQRKQSIEAVFEKAFWQGKYYSSSVVVDERANAMAVLTGLCPKEHYSDICLVLVSTFNASVYMENYVLMALCEMGFMKEAYLRMTSRYYNLAVNENSTLWEDFFILGTTNHAWSGAPATIAFRYFLGIDTTDGFETFTVNPVKGLFQEMEATFATAKGQATVRVKGDQVEIIEK